MTDGPDRKTNNLAIYALLALVGVTFTLFKERMDRQELQASNDISALREEIKTTKADNKDAIAAAAAASRDAVAATAAASKDAVTATATALKDSVAATAAASTASVAATAVSAKNAVDAIASALSEKNAAIEKRVEKLEDRDYASKAK